MSTLIRCQTPINSLSNWLEDFLPNNLFETSDRQISANSWPKVDIAESDESFSIHADLPGMEKKDVSVTIDNNVIKIEGEKAEEHKTEKTKYYHFERNYGKFSRSFALPEGIDTQKITAVMKNGVLELTLPKTPKAQPKAIDIKID
ncbi:MAG: Hsp20/alpha crystallin family protein [Fibrobacter sp.]|nr:Hsp20/alpha crystallin family protein [Fibrobacter sp.]